MDKKIKIGIVALVIMFLVLGYFFLVPHYKEIEMSGMNFEVPLSTAEVSRNTDNYNTYTDTLNNLEIKTWSCRNINDLNGTVNGSIEMGIQLGENMGNVVEYNGIELLNKSGTYTYYESDYNNACILLITCDNLNTIEHILDTLKKPTSNANLSQYMPSSDLISNVNVNNGITDNSISSSGVASVGSSNANSNKASTEVSSSSGSEHVSSVSSNYRSERPASTQQSSSRSNSRPSYSTSSYSSGGSGYSYSSHKSSSSGYSSSDSSSSSGSDYIFDV